MCHLLAWVTAHRGSRSAMGQMTDTYYFLHDRSDAFFKMQIWLCQKLSCNYNCSWLRIKILLWPVLAYCSRDSSVCSHTMAKPTLFILTGPSLATMCPILYNPEAVNRLLASLPPAFCPILSTSPSLSQRNFLPVFLNFGPDSLIVWPYSTA